jgi:hypothetical protein
MQALLDVCMRLESARETETSMLSLRCNTALIEAESGMDEPMNCSEGKRELPDAGVDPLPLRSTMLCSLRVVPVSSEHFPGWRYVMELATASRARELRVFRSLDLLMAGVAELGLRVDVRESLHRQLVDEECCQLRDIVL